MISSRQDLNRRSTEDFQGSKTAMCVILYWWIRFIIHFSKPIEDTLPRMGPNGNYELW